jgi:hypothetical protein
VADTDEKVGLTRARNARVARVRSIAKLLDSAIRIPGTRIRFGVDAVVGLIPGLGDVAGAVFSGYLILLGSRMGLPPHIITRMVTNVAIDTIAGGVPILGDLFDVAWKSNLKNVALLEQFTDPQGTAEASSVSRWIIAGALLILLLLVIGGIWLAVMVIRMLLGR